MSEMKNVMVDLETMGKRAGCVILSIGAVEFDPLQGLGREFYKIISIESCKAAGLHIDPSTMEWWEKQSSEARQVLKDAHSINAMSLENVLLKFNTWLAQTKGVKVWGNGADFDNAILISAYAAVGVPQGWGPYNSRCYRTLKGFFPQVKAVRGGTHHNALDDAKTQALHAIQLAQLVPLAW